MPKKFKQALDVELVLDMVLELVCHYDVFRILKKKKILICQFFSMCRCHFTYNWGSLMILERLQTPSMP